jgi:serine/threonine protein kinase
MIACPGPDALRRLLASELDEEQRGQLRAHAETCSACRNGLRGSPDTTDLTGAPSSSLPPPAESADLDSEAVLPELPGYEILRVLGRGGMGVVYLARDPALNRLVALKMLLGGAQASEQEQARLRAEAEAAARIHHPHVVQVFTTGRHNGCPYLVCEYVEGGSLAARLDRRPQRPRDAARLVELLARGVQAAHQRGIVHRDLKPANVLLAPAAEEAALNSAYGVPKVADFGLARYADESRRQTAGGLVGSAASLA